VLRRIGQKFVAGDTLEERSALGTNRVEDFAYRYGSRIVNNRDRSVMHLLFAVEVFAYPVDIISRRTTSSTLPYPQVQYEMKARKRPTLTTHNTQ
jgi:hypothetical protein